MVEIAIPKHGPKLGEGFSQEEKLKAIEIHRQTDPKRGYQTPAAFVSDLASLHKIIILCSSAGLSSILERITIATLSTLVRAGCFSMVYVMDAVLQAVMSRLSTKRNIRKSA